MAAGQRKETIRVKWKLAACHHLSAWVSLDKLGQSVSDPNPATTGDVSFLFIAPVLGQFPTDDYGRLITDNRHGKGTFNRNVIFRVVPVYYEFFPPGTFWETWFEMEMERLGNYDLALLADVTFCKSQTFEQERGNWINCLELIFLQEIVWNNNKNCVPLVVEI